MHRALLLASWTLVNVLLPGSGSSADETAKVYRIGLLGSSSATASAHYVASLRDGLRKLGYVEGRNITIEYQWAEGQFDRLPTLAAILTNQRLDVIVGFGGAQVTRALKAATRSVPVVFLTDDPVVEGVVDSLAKPGGNLTGVSVMSVTLEAKRVELIKEALPQATRVAVLFNPDHPLAAVHLEAMERPAHELGLEVVVEEARRLEEVDGALTALSRSNTDALLVLTDPMLNTQRARIVDFAAKNHLPGFYFWREFVEIGGLMSYGASLGEMTRRMAPYIDKILRGEKPGDLPIEQPVRFELVINLRTAQTLGLTLPLPLLARADEVIE